MAYSRSVCWLRRDLRLSDQRALYQACRESREVVLVFVFDTTILSKLKNKEDRRVDFIHRSLKVLREKVAEFGSDILILHGDPAEEIPKAAKALNAEAVFANEDYEPAAKKRDSRVSERLAALEIEFHGFKDQVIFSGTEILKNDGEPYKVFTPYKRAWLKNLRPVHYGAFQPELERLAKKAVLKRWLNEISLDDLGFKETDLALQAGETAARKHLAYFSKFIEKYAEQRDFPATPTGTSKMSVHLRFGTISIRECIRLCLSKKSKGAEVWLGELIWREFYQMILDRFPQVENEEFLEKYRGLKWPGTAGSFKAWCEGKTGYPIVDAGMRQLNATGWMHNRLRMITASFLVKDLLVDWRKGEKYFAEKLLDFDLAANNGGWQWCASTGCDAQPYFRIFNPVEQSKKFDPDGKYIRTWVPELLAVNAPAVHFPAAAKPHQLPAGFAVGKNYVEPIVDHSVQRKLALGLYKKNT